MIQREHREQREQAICSNILSNNSSNNLFENSENISIQRPCYQSHNEWFILNGEKMKPGVYLHGRHLKDGKLCDIDEWICSPLIVTAITSSPNQNHFGRLLKFQDSHGMWHEWAMPMYLLKGNGDELRGELLNQGVIFNPKRRNDIINYLMSHYSDQKIIAVDHIGWYEDTFVLPNQLIGSTKVVFQSETVIESEFQRKGTLVGWQQEIAKFCEDNIPLMLSVAAALSGTLLKHLDRQQGAGLHWLGDSSSGKSTAVEIAASVWGAPEFIRSWSATANGLEGIAASRNDTCLILDEIDEASPHEIGKIVYMLVNGQGKQRAGKVGYARKIQRWRLITLSTGERSISSLLKEIGKRPNAGQLVRLLSIPSSFEHGIFSELHGFESGRALADHLKCMRLKHYGHLGSAFIEKLRHEKRAISNTFDLILQDITPTIATNLEKRAASTFSLIALAGELAIEYNLLPWHAGSVINAATIAFQRWQSLIGSGQTEDNQILQSISDFIAKYGDSRFSHTHEHQDRAIHNRAGWYKDTPQGRTYMFFPIALTEAGNGFERSRIVEALKRANWITETDHARMTKKVRTNAGLKNLYHITLIDE